jgi:hypothetical protein
MKDIGSVMRSMSQVLRGGNLAEYYERIKTRVKLDNDQKVGEMKSFLKSLDPMISRIDRNNAITAKEARATIEGFMTKSKLLTEAKVVSVHEKFPLVGMDSPTNYAEVFQNKIKK